MSRSFYALLVVSLLTLGLGGVGSSPATIAAKAKPAEAPLCLASNIEPMLGCGETRCTHDSDCPSTCGGCITWSGTCALFQPR